MNSLTLTIPVEGCELRPSAIQRDSINAYLRERNGKTVTVKFARPTTSRTLQQNAYLWGVIYTTIAQHTGHTTEEIHSVLKNRFLPRRFVKLGTIETEVRKSTADLTVTEFTAYLEQLRAWASQELGITFDDLEFTRTPTRTRTGVTR